MAKKMSDKRKKQAKKVLTKNKGLLGGAARGILRRQTKVRKMLDNL